MKYAIYSLTVVMILISTSIGIASASNDKNPFEMVWEAITNIQNQIDNIVLLPGPQGEQGPIGPQGPKGDKGESGEDGSSSSSLILKDANGQIIGNVMDIDRTGVYSVFVPEINSKIEVINFNGSASVGSEPSISDIWFKTTDCTGDAHVNRNLPLNVLMKTDFGIGKYYVTKAEVVPVQNYFSKLTSGGCIQWNNSGSFPEITEITLPFTEPLAWPLTVVTE